MADFTTADIRAMFVDPTPWANPDRARVDFDEWLAALGVVPVDALRVLDTPDDVRAIGDGADGRVRRAASGHGAGQGSASRPAHRTRGDRRKPLRAAQQPRRPRMNDNDTQRWIAMAKVILAEIKVNDEPALDFIDRVLIALPSPRLDLRTPGGE